RRRHTRFSRDWSPDVCSSDLAARVVLAVNIVQGDALAMAVPSGAPITFPEWGYLGKGKFQRRDFRFDNLAQRASFKGTLWEQLRSEERRVGTECRTGRDAQ